MSDSRQTAPASEKIPRIEVYWTAVTYRTVAMYLSLVLVVVLATTSWPIGLIGNAGPGVGEALGTKYVVGLAVLVVILASAALGSGLMLAAPTLPSLRGGGSIRGSGPRR